MKKKMNTKNLMVSFLAVVFVLAIALTTVSAAPITGSAEIQVNDALIGSVGSYSGAPFVSSLVVVEGETMTVQVMFTATQNDSDVTIKAEIEVEGEEDSDSTTVFDVVNGNTYIKTLKLKVPYGLEDSEEGILDLDVKIEGKDHETELDTIELEVQREPYKTDIKSVTVPSSIDAGETFPVEVVLKNMGFNDLDDVYVTVQIADLGLSQGPKWVGDLVTFEGTTSNDDDEDTVVGSFYLEVPFDVEAGVYTLEVIVENDDMTSTVTKQIVVNNEFTANVMTTDEKKTIAEGEEAVYEILLVNPTNNVKVYKLVSESGDVSSTVSQTIVAVPAGSSKTVKIYASADEEGEYSFDVSVFTTADELVESLTFDLLVEGKSNNSTVILTVILAIIFLVLLVVLIVLLGRKPEKTEDFGESYY